MKRYHITFENDVGGRQSDGFASSVDSGHVVSTTSRFNGRNDLALIDVADGDCEYLESLIDEDKNVLGYRVYEQ